MDNLVFAQGQVAPLYCQFVTSPAGQPVDVPDAEVAVYGVDDLEILAPVDMVNYDTGFYSYSFTIPMSLAVGTYTVRFTGTVQGTPTAVIAYLQVLLAGTPTSVTLSQRQVALIGAVDSYIGMAQRIPVYNALTTRNRTYDEYRTTWTNWNLGNHIVMRNGNIIESGYEIDLNNGLIQFDDPQHSTDIITVSYNFRYFTQNDLLQFLYDGLGAINLEPPATIYSLDTIPNNNYTTLTIQGAVVNALKRIIFDLQFADPSTIFKENGKSAIDNFFKLKENYEKNFIQDKKTMKTLGPYPKTVAVVPTNFSLPGARSRWFRALYSSTTM